MRERLKADAKNVCVCVSRKAWPNVLREIQWHNTKIIKKVVTVTTQN